MKLKYSFNQQIENQLKPFKNWLAKEGYAPESIRIKTNHAGWFLRWLEKEQLQPENTGYNDMISFIGYCKQEGESNKLINNKLLSARNYYTYLKKQGQSTINPAAGLYLKGEKQKIPSNITSYPELENLYATYNTETLRQKRNKVILGLLIYQGISAGELAKLGPGHLKLKEGNIYIPGTRKRNSRQLELKPFQILELQEYVNETRLEIIAQINKPKPARKPGKINKNKLNELLFVSINGSHEIKSSIRHLFREIRKTRPEFISAKQLRASVIAHWLKNYNLRQVQYMAGHKYVSSTEYYQLDNLESLQEKLEKLHPLNTTNQ